MTKKKISKESVKEMVAKIIDDLIFIKHYTRTDIARKLDCSANAVKKWQFRECEITHYNYLQLIELLNS